MNLIGKEVYVKHEGIGVVVGYDCGCYIIDLREGGTVECSIDRIRIV